MSIFRAHCGAEWPLCHVENVLCPVLLFIIRLRGVATKSKCLKPLFSPLMLMPYWRALEKKKISPRQLIPIHQPLYRHQIQERKLQR